MGHPNDRKILEILKRYGEEWTTENVWRVKQTNEALIKSACLQRIAFRAGIVWDMPQVVLATPDSVAILVSASRELEPDEQGEIRKRFTWSIGEAAIGRNYIVSGKQAAYVWSMAEKRGKDRVILSLLGLDDNVGELQREHGEERVASQSPDEPAPEPMQAINSDPIAPEEENPIDEDLRANAPPPDELEDWQRAPLPTDTPKVKLKRLIKQAENREDIRVLFGKGNVDRAMQAMSRADYDEVTRFVNRHLDELEKKPAGIVSSDPTHQTNVVTLPTRISNSIGQLTVEHDIDKMVEDYVSEAGGWDNVPGEVEIKIAQVVESRKAFLARSR